MLHWHTEFEWPHVAAFLKRKILSIVRVAEKNDLLVQNIYFFGGLGDLCRDETNKVNLDAGVLEARRGVEGEMTYEQNRLITMGPFPSTTLTYTTPLAGCMSCHRFRLIAPPSTNRANGKGAARQSSLVVIWLGRQE